MTLAVIDHFTRPIYGFPAGSPRRVKPLALVCIHITGNSSTAASANLHGAAQGERNYANGHAGGPSASHYVARDGWTIEALDWKRYAAWSNGDVNSPNTANAGIRRVLALRARGYNANEAYWLEIENVGFPGTYPITDAQRQACAERIAEAARYSGLPVNRETVHGHWEINGIDRQRCPDIHHEAFLVDVIARANALLAPPKEPDMPGTTYNPAGTPIGQADVITTGHALYDPATREYEQIGTGSWVVFARGVANTDAPPAIAGKPFFVVISKGRAKWLLENSATFTAAPASDVNDAVNRALDQVRANATAGVATAGADAIAAAVAKARPA